MRCFVILVAPSSRCRLDVRLDGVSMAVDRRIDGGVSNGWRAGMCAVVDVRAASGRMLRAERKLLRVQRRLWLAQLVFWPAVITLAVVAVVAAWKWWQRSAQRRPDRDTGTTVPSHPDAPPIAGAGQG